MKTIISLQMQFDKHIITLWNGEEWECETDPLLADVCRILSKIFVPSSQQFINPFEVMARGFKTYYFEILKVDKSEGEVNTL